MNFAVIDNEAEIREIEASTRNRGMTDKFFKNLSEFYATWAEVEDNAGKSFLIYLNHGDDAPFAGRPTDSLYGSLKAAMGRLNLNEEWRLIKRSVSGSEDKVLVIAKL